MITSHLLYPLSYPALRSVGLEPTSSGLPRRSTAELRPHPRSAEPETAKRPAPAGISTSPNTRPSEEARLVASPAGLCKYETTYSCKLAIAVALMQQSRGPLARQSRELAATVCSHLSGATSAHRRQLRTNAKHSSGVALTASTAQAPAELGACRSMSAGVRVTASF